MAPVYTQTRPTLKFVDAKTFAQTRKPTLSFIAAETLQCQEMEHSSTRSTCIQTPGGRQVPSGVYSPIPVYMTGQCIAGTAAHKETLHNARTRDMYIGIRILHPGPWPVLLRKDGQSTCTALNEMNMMN